MKTTPEISINKNSQPSLTVGMKPSAEPKSRVSQVPSDSFTKQAEKAHDIFDFTVPTDYGRMLGMLQHLSDRYPFFGITHLGTSLLGRKIPLIKLGNEGAKRYVLYVGTHHGCEHITASVLLKFCLDYCMQYERKSRVYGISLENLYSSVLICIVPMLNPDGAEIAINGFSTAGSLAQKAILMNGGGDFVKWKANARGVDLNHNYKAGFKEYKKIEIAEKIRAGSEKYSGEFPESEPETGCLCNYIRFNENIAGCLTLHSQGEVIYTGSNTNGIVGKLLEKITGYRLSIPDGSALYGGLTDYLTSEMNIPSYTLECGRGENPLPQNQLADIYLKLREALFSFPIML